MGEGEEGGLVGSAEPGDPNLAGGPVLPMKLRVCRSGICLLSLCNSSYSLCCPLWPPKVVPKRLTARSCWRGHIQYTSRLVFAFFDSITEGRRSPSLSATSKHTWITQAYVMDAFFWSFLVFVATSKHV